VKDKFEGQGLIGGLIYLLIVVKTSSTKQFGLLYVLSFKLFCC